MIDKPTPVYIEYDSRGPWGRLSIEGQSKNSIWDRLKQFVYSVTADYKMAPQSIEVSWPVVLDIIREYSGKQSAMGFRFVPKNDESRERISRFISEYRRVKEARGTLSVTIPPDEINARLLELGFNRRSLTKFQLRDLAHLLSLQNGANFSVPGAGKTTVTFALHMLTRQRGSHILVVGPKASFPAWREVVNDCIGSPSPDASSEPFIVLADLPRDEIQGALNSGATRFLINYDLMINVPDVISSYLAGHPVHLVLDESHRMKAGMRSQRGGFLLGVASLPIRRDILSGTPMPQQPSDIQSQLDFLWPGAGLGQQIDRGSNPRDVLGQLYVRTTKDELGLPKPKRSFIKVKMADGQMALYSVVRDEALRQLSEFRKGKVDLSAAKKSVMRLLQLSSNPLLALNSIMQDSVGLESGIIDAVIAEGPSTKMRAVAELATSLASQGRKSIIWTIFTDTLVQMETLLAHLNPVSLYGATPSGDSSDLDTREGKIRRFHEDKDCHVMLANPAAVGEGISLHKVCHDAIYLDRSYVVTHYLQSIDRIHRLGLDPSVETNIHIFQTMAPRGVGCIDHSVSRRLALKLRALQALLDDPDIHEVALDEENNDDPVDLDIDIQDVIDLIEQLEGKDVFRDSEEA